MTDRIAEIIADHLFAKLVEGGYVTKAAEAPTTDAPKAPDKPADAPKGKGKAATAPKPADKAADAPKLTQPQVQALLKEYAAKNGRDKAMAILTKYAGSVTELSDADLPKVVAALKGEPDAPATDVDLDF